MRTFTRHKKPEHAGEAEYRNRVLCFMADVGSRPSSPQEKMMLVQNCAGFQQYCRPGTKGNRFSGPVEVPRSEAACAACAQKDSREQQQKLRLIALAAEKHVSERAAVVEGAGRGHEGDSDSEAGAP